MAAFARASTMKQRYASSSVPYRCFTLTGSDSEHGLVGAMDDDDARRILELVPQADYRRISANHVVHVYRPRQFIRAVLEFARDVEKRLEIAKRSPAAEWRYSPARAQLTTPTPLSVSAPESVLATQVDAVGVVQQVCAGLPMVGETSDDLHRLRPDL